MIGAVILIPVLYFITQALLQNVKKSKPWFDVNLMNKLFWYHVFFTAVYYVTVMNVRSDSTSYYLRTQAEYRYWFDAFQTGTRFIDFVSYPFVNYLNFSYEMMMVLFAWSGFWGFVYFYIFFKENIHYKHKWQGFDLISLFIFLPNMHFWTASLGKGSLIFLGISMVMYGLSKLKERVFPLIMGLAIVYYIRPPVFLFMTVGILAGIFTGRQKIPTYQKVLVFAGTAIALAFMYNSIIAFVGLDSDNVTDSFGQFSSNRAYELSKSGSGIDISNYPLWFKLFTFWFRPLFVDSPNFSGLIVSVENVLYLVMAVKLFKKGFLKFLGKSSALVKTCVVSFFATSLALAQTLSNMGIIIRQKSMIMYFFLFVAISFFDYQKELKEANAKKPSDKATSKDKLKVSKAVN